MRQTTGRLGICMLAGSLSLAVPPGRAATPAGDWLIGGQVLLAAQTYRDGVFSATGQYGGGPSFLPVTITLSQGIVTRVEVGTPATNPVSLDYQRRFAAAVPGVVVGKPIDQLKIGRLAGSSLTPAGFNAAIAQIRNEAAH